MIRKMFGMVLGKGPTRIYKGYVRVLRLSGAVARIRRVKWVKVLEESWNYLIVLDACRYDYFEKCNTMKGELGLKKSGGSCTPEWLKANFNGYYDDIVYVSGNPYVSNVEWFGFKGIDHFYRVEPCWDYAWNPETGTVHPEKVVEGALKAKEKFPTKRLIVHFMQPHAPYIGCTQIQTGTIAMKDDNQPRAYKAERMHEVWRKVRNGEIPIGTIRRAYEDNLRLVLREVEGLVDKLDGRIVITSDHGECFNEWFVTAHPEGVRLKQLVNVPWLVIEKDLKGKSDSASNGEKEKIRKRVEALKSMGRI